MSFSMEKQKTFLPAGVVISSGLLIVGGFAAALVGTSIIELKGDIALSLLNGFELFKTSSLKTNHAALSIKLLAGLAMIITGARLLTCKADARSHGVGLLAATGLFFPVFISIKMSRIDFEFIYVFRAALTLITCGALYYLTRPETVAAIEGGGVTANLTTTYCPLCETSTDDETCRECIECGTKLCNLYETKDGYNFAVPVENDLT